MAANVKNLTPEARKLAVQLLPDTPHSIAQKITVLNQQIAKLRNDGAAANSAKEVIRQKMLSDLISQLATLTQAAAKMKKRHFEGTTAITKSLTPEQHKVESTKLVTQLVETQKQINAIAQVVGKGDAAVQERNKVRAAQLVAQKEALEQKKKMVDEGKAPVEPIKLEPHVVSVQRKPLPLPAVFGTPTPAEVNVIMKMLSMGLKRYQRESDESYQMRLRAYSKRALTRLARMTIVAGQERSNLIQFAVAETLKEDAPAIEAEFKMGGEVKDPSADAMDSFVDAQTPELVAISETAPAEIPALPPTEEQTQDLVDTSTSVAQDLATLPEEPTDTIRDALESGEIVVPGSTDVVSTVRSGVSWGHVFVFGAVIAGGIYLYKNR